MGLDTLIMGEQAQLVYLLTLETPKKKEHLLSICDSTLSVAKIIEEREAHTKESEVEFDHWLGLFAHHSTEYSNGNIYRYYPYQLKEYELEDER